MITPGLGTEIKMNIDINFGITEIQVSNIDINFDITEIQIMNIDINLGISEICFNQFGFNFKNTLLTLRSRKTFVHRQNTLEFRNQINKTLPSLEHRPLPCGDIIQSFGPLSHAVYGNSIKFGNPL